jgi:hypothetical protein
MLKTLIHITIFLLATSSLSAQVTRIRGIVKDADTNEPIPFVSVYFQNTQIGTITNTEGEYFLENRISSDSIVVSVVGYEAQKKAIKKNQFQEIDFYLRMNMLFLDEIVILPTENPAHPILRNIIKNKNKHNPNQFESYYHKTYNKIELGTDNVDERLMRRRSLADFRFIFDYVDTSAITGKVFLPLLIAETFSEFYYRKSPLLEKEIISASRLSGFDNESMSQLAGNMYQKINIYDNFLTIFEPGFVSPISDFGLSFYKYYLIDSTFLDDKWCYQISFVPRREQDRTFRGNFWVNDTTFAIKQIQMRTAKNINYNYIGDFVAEYDYQTVNDSIWFLKQEKLFFNINLYHNSKGFFVNKTTIYDDVALNESIPDEIVKRRDKIVVSDNLFIKDEDFWINNRPIPLAKHEENIYSMVDSVQNVPIYRFYEKLVGMFVMFYYEVGYLELGPYFQTFSYNEIEGYRFRASGRTSNKFSKKLMLHSYAAYGLRDERFKYGGGLLYVFDNNPRAAISADYQYDLRQLGKSDFALKDDNIFKSLLSRTPNTSLTMVEEIKVKAEKEWFQGFTNTLVMSHQRIESGHFFEFRKVEQGQIIDVEDIKTTEVNLSFRITKDEKFLRGEFERKSLGTVKPVLNVLVTKGFKNVIGSEFDYWKLGFNLSQKVDLSPIGYFRYIIDAGKIWGDVPFPLLKLHEGNETYMFDRYAFNLMNYYEFASDTYLSIYVDHHFQGLLLNRIPYVRYLKLREVVSAKGLIGKLDSRHSEILLYPAGLRSLSHPYYEVSAGIENIFKLFRVDAVWRLNYLDNPDVDKFGVRITMQFTF